MNTYTAIVVEPDASEEDHKDAIKEVLKRKSQNL